MTTTKQTISVRLDVAAKKRVEKAARILKQSSGAFLERAGEREARTVLTAWAVDRYREDGISFSELASQTGLTVEEVMLAIGESGAEDALGTFLESVRVLAAARGNPEFLRAGEQAVDLLRSKPRA